MITHREQRTAVYWLRNLRLRRPPNSPFLFFCLSYFLSLSVDIYTTIRLKINQRLDLAFQVEFRDGHPQNGTAILFSKLSTDHFLYLLFSPLFCGKDKSGYVILVSHVSPKLLAPLFFLFSYLF